MCCVSVFRRATVIPTSQCSTSPGWMIGSSPSLLASDALALHLDARLEPGAEPLIVGALTPPPHEVARVRRARHDHLVREHRLRHLPDERGHLLEERFFFRQPRRDQLERQPLGIAKLRRPRRAERLAHPLQLAARQAVAERERRRAVDADHLRLPLVDHLLERHPLLVAPELGLTAAHRGGDGSSSRCARRRRRPARCRRARSARHTTASPARRRRRTCRRTRRSSGGARRTFPAR